MLEENVANENLSPAETALAVLNFLQSELPAGGTAAEKRFINFFVPLCNRVFGKIDEESSYRHKEGGWLSSQHGWSWQPQQSRAPHLSRSPIRTPRGSTTTPGNNMNSSDPVVKLLGAGEKTKSNAIPSPTLIESISKESENRPAVCFAFFFLGLPQFVQEQWLAVLEYSPRATNNSVRLFGDLLRPLEQVDLQNHRQKSLRKSDHHPVQLTPRGFGLTSPVASPPKEETADPKTAVSPKVMLTMLEYYLFLFLRFPLAAPIPFASPTSRTRRESYGDRVYFDVFKKVLRHFLPFERDDNRHINFTDSRQSELFVRILISLWMEPQTRMEQTQNVVRVMVERKTRQGGMIMDSTTPALLHFDLDSSYDLTVCKYEPPPPQVQRCVRALLVRLIADQYTSRALQQPGLEWCLSPVMTAVQPSFYNLIRGTFRHASVHSSGSPFYSTFNVWLIWLEPWNVTTPTSRVSPRQATQRVMSPIIANEKASQSRTVVVPKYNQKSKYTATWEPYLAANLYFYLIPLSIFLRRARELDFSPAKFEHSVSIIKQVFRVYSPELVQTLNRLLSDACDAHSKKAIQYHRESLGDFAPPPGPLTMASYRTDMHNLLDEIHMQHKKLVREQDRLDRFVGNFEGLFGQGVVQREGKALVSLLESARLIAQLPLDYKIERADGSTTTSDSSGPMHKTRADRRENGELSSIGAEQLLNGFSKCSPKDVMGDKRAVSVIGEFELEFLVEFFVSLSQKLNERIGVSADDPNPMIRFDLRFFADYRNLAFCVFIFYMAAKLTLVFW